MARSDESVTVRAWATGAVGEIGRPEAVDLLSELVKDKSWVVRRAAVYGLGQAGDDGVAPLLAAASKRERWTMRRVYRRALGQLNKASREWNTRMREWSGMTPDDRLGAVEAMTFRDGVLGAHASVKGFRLVATDGRAGRVSWASYAAGASYLVVTTGLLRKAHRVLPAGAVSQRR